MKKNKVEISHDLKMEIVTNYKGVESEQHYCNCITHDYKNTRIPLYKENKLTLNLSDNLKLFKECTEWFEMIVDNFSIKMKIDIGCFLGLWPVEIDVTDMSVIFSIDMYDSNNQNWKDWFIMEEENASKVNF